MQSHVDPTHALLVEIMRLRSQNQPIDGSGMGKVDARQGQLK
jgi:hypothetical protein